MQMQGIFANGPSINQGPISLSVLRFVSGTLTNAELQNLNTVPKNVILAPGAGKIILPLWGYSRMQVVTQGVNAVSLNLQYNNTTNPTSFLPSWPTHSNQVAGFIGDTWTGYGTGFAGTSAAIANGHINSGMRLVGSVAWTPGDVIFQYTICWQEVQVL